jgi:hypothetical protein
VLWLYGGLALGVFLVVTWFLRRGFSSTEVKVPRVWRIAGQLVWASLFLGGFNGLSAMAAPVLTNLPDTAAVVVGGVLFGLVVALVVYLGAAISMRADMGMWRWAVLYQVIALAGVVLLAGRPGAGAALLLAVVPLCGLVALASAFRNPPQPVKPRPATPTKKRR